jgi:hypothetical protein
MLEPIKQVQQARQESLRNLLSEIEKKQSTLQEKRTSLEKLCQGYILFTLLISKKSPLRGLKGNIR